MSPGVTTVRLPDSVQKVQLNVMADTLSRLPETLRGLKSLQLEVPGLCDGGKRPCTEIFRTERAAKTSDHGRCAFQSGYGKQC